MTMTIQNKYADIPFFVNLDTEIDRSKMVKSLNEANNKASRFGLELSVNFDDIAGEESCESDDGWRYAQITVSSDYPYLVKCDQRKLFETHFKDIQGLVFECSGDTPYIYNNKGA